MENRAATLSRRSHRMSGSYGFKSSNPATDLIALISSVALRPMVCLKHTGRQTCMLILFFTSVNTQACSLFIRMTYGVRCPSATLCTSLAYICEAQCTVEPVCKAASAPNLYFAMLVACQQQFALCVQVAHQPHPSQQKNVFIL